MKHIYKTLSWVALIGLMLATGCKPDFKAGDAETPTAGAHSGYPASTHVSTPSRGPQPQPYYRQGTAPRHTVKTSFIGGRRGGGSHSRSRR